MSVIRIGGVPEHFNFPWITAVENGLFAQEGINLEWHTYPGGTGAMAEALNKKEIDLAVLLTEGAVNAICSGSDLRIISGFTESPLLWGIHRSAGAAEKDLSACTFAISRFGSGSHIMPYVYADSKSLKLTEERMVVVKNLEGAREALATGKADLFFWEKFMTKPLVDSGEFTLYDELPTPWPCFVIVSNREFLNKNNKIIKQALGILHQWISVLKEDITLASRIASFYHLKTEDVALWLSKLVWCTEVSINKAALKKAGEALTKTGILPFMPEPDTLIEII